MILSTKMKKIIDQLTSNDERKRIWRSFASETRRLIFSLPGASVTAAIMNLLLTRDDTSLTQCGCLTLRGRRDVASHRYICFLRLVNVYYFVTYIPGYTYVWIYIRKA